jgi:2-oxoglutarate ferredoxin oxidoreductase subunit beta
MHDGSRLYLKKLEQDYNPLDKMQAIQVLNETRSRGEFATGLIYVEPKKADFIDVLNLVDDPLATLPENRVRPPESVLGEIMKGLR